MKRMMNARMSFVGFIATILTALLVTASFYQMNEKKAWNQLEDLGKVFANTNGDLEQLKKMSFGMKNHFRITMIDKSGNVTFDNRIDISKMENHFDREEVILAKKYGMAKVIRVSDTVGKPNFYYAIHIGQNEILRIAENTDHIRTTFISVIPLTVLVALSVVILCFILSHGLARGLIRPIEDMAHGKMEVPYPELEPFLRSIEERKELEKMKQEFTANVSHELKTPLTSISGYAELIESGMVSEDNIKVFAERIHAESTRLKILIGDIMKLAELEEPGEIYNFEVFSLSEVVNECFLALELSAKKNHVIMSMIGEEKPIYGDRKLISELVYNLCDNAIRYNYEGGKVMVSLSRVEDEIYLQIRDTGIGIPKKHWDGIFRRFYRVDKSRSKETGGTGLGLAIVKHIAELHGAKIKVDSTVGKGTKITILFKAAGGRT